MGNWRNRPPRRFFNRQRPAKSPPEYDRDPSSASGFCEDGIPLWEKKFCALIGSVPWQKIVHAKKFMYSNNILNWDDLAGKEAFQNAKERFWAEINGFPCDISLPNPDIYIDEIDWNPVIDPELIEDLESVYFAPNGGENDGMYGHKHKKARNLTDVASKGFNGNSEIKDNPWESNKYMQDTGTLNDKAQDWNQWNNSNNDSRITFKDDHCWERSFTLGDEVVKDKGQGWIQWESSNNHSKKLNYDNNLWQDSFNCGNKAIKDNTWGNSGNKFRGLDQGVNHVNQFRNWDNTATSWERGCQGVYHLTSNKGWGDIGNSCCWSQQKSCKFDSGDNSWKHRYVQSSGPPNDGGWRDYGGNPLVWKRQDNYSAEPRHSELKRSSRGWGAWNEGCRKREGSHLTGYKSYGYQRDYKQTGHCWRSRNANKRVQFCT